jgi:hypothetical protein
MKIFFWFPVVLCALQVGVGKVEITPPVGTPSAGYRARNGMGMEGCHDPLMAVALVLDDGVKRVAFCSVDHLGFTREMVEAVKAKVGGCEVYIGSTHTHSGGGAFLDVPLIGFSLAGTYDAAVKESYVEGAARAILEASQTVPGKLGIGYGEAEDLSYYRSSWPEGVEPLRQVTVMKVTKEDGEPLAVLFNYPIHPTILDADNRLFSADFVGYAREYLCEKLGVEAIYFNGAQGDIAPRILNEADLFDACDQTGRSLAGTVVDIWGKTEVGEATIETKHCGYSFKPEATPFGMQVPIASYESEMNVIVFNGEDAFVTIPGELSCIYDRQLKKTPGYRGISILGLTNDAHGYIITPDSWAHKTFESRLSFGGQWYGDQVEERAAALLKKS